LKKQKFEIWRGEEVRGEDEKKEQSCVVQTLTYEQSQRFCRVRAKLSIPNYPLIP
jgi:hypothetical protein